MPENMTALEFAAYLEKNNVCKLKARRIFVGSGQKREMAHVIKVLVRADDRHSAVRVHAVGRTLPDAFEDLYNRLKAL